MFSPEVWRLKPSSGPKTVKTELDIDSPEIIKLLNSHPFNHNVTVVLPDTMYLPSSVTDELEVDSSYYKITGVPLHRLVDSWFIDSFIKKGRASFLSLDTPNDVSNSFALTPTGILVLSLVRSDFLELGLSRSSSVRIVASKDQQKFSVQINLKDPTFVSSKNNYKRVKSRLKASDLEADFVFLWEPNDQNVCPSSLAAYLAKLGYKITLCTLKSDKTLRYNVQAPPFSSSPDDLLVWMSLQSLGPYTPSDTIEAMYLSSYEISPAETLGQVLIHRWTGLISESKLNGFFTALRNYLADRGGDAVFGLMIVGFEDAAVAWLPANSESEIRPHRFITCGDNNLSFILRSKRKAVMFKSTLPPT